ncbi:MAG: PaaI family thioesterase [Caldimonas sp.]
MDKAESSTPARGLRRAEITPEVLHARQADCLPGRFGLVVTRIDDRELDAEVAIAPWMLAPNGFLHAASVLLLADTAAGYACVAHLPEGAKNFTTLELKSNFLGTTREGTIRTECRAEHLGRTTQVWAATVFGPDDRQLALFRCTQLVLW